MRATAYRMDNNEQAYTNNSSYNQNQEGLIINFEEYQIRLQVEQKGKSIKPRKKISVWGAIMVGTGGLLAAVGSVALMGLTEEKAVFVLYILWLFFGGALACLFDNVGV